MRVFYVSCSIEGGRFTGLLSWLERGPEDTALRSKRPRCNHKNSKEEANQDVECVNAVVTSRHVGCGRACHVEEDAGIRPFLKPRKTRHEQSYGSKHLPKPEDGQEVQWVAKNVHYALDVSRQMRQFRHATAPNGEHEECCGNPVTNHFSFHNVNQRYLSLQPRDDSLQA